MTSPTFEQGKTHKKGLTFDKLAK